MNAAVIVDVNTEREKGNKIIVQEVNRTINDELIPTEDLDTVGLMDILCNGIILLIHSAHKTGLKKDYESLEDCIAHIKKGFVDASYITSVTKDGKEIS